MSRWPELWSALPERIGRVKALLRRRGQSREDAEDLVQEAFLRLHMYLDAGHEVRQPEALLVRTALNLAVDASRRDRRDHRDQHLAAPVEELDLPDLAPTPEERCLNHQRLMQIRRVLETRVGPRTREAFLMHRLEGFKHQEIADRMGISVRTVENHIARAVTAIWMERNPE